MSTYAVTIKASGQIFSVNVFANNTIQAIEYAKNQTMGRIGKYPRFQIVSVVPFNSCGGAPTIVVPVTSSQRVSNFVASGGKVNS